MKLNEEPTVSNAYTQVRQSTSIQARDIRTPSGYLAAKYDEETKQLIILNHKEFVKIQILPDQKIQVVN